LPAEPRRHEAVREHAVGLFLRRRERDHPLGKRLIVEQIARGFLGRPDEVVAHGYAFHPHPGGRDQRQRLHAQRVAHCDLGGDPAAEGIADDVDAVGAEVIEKVEVVHRHVGDVPDGAGVVERAEPGMLGHEHVVMASELLEQRKPAGPAARAMQEQQRFARARPQQAHGDVADLVLKFARHGHGGRLPWTERARQCAAIRAIAPVAPPHLRRSTARW
jgi:hypothetical protein